MNKWLKKLWCLYIPWNIIQPYKNEEILPLTTTWIDPEGIMLSDISQRQKNIV